MIRRRGQSIMEYATLFAVIAAVLIAMAIYFKRSGHQYVRKASDQWGEGEQFSPMATTGFHQKVTNSNVQMMTMPNGASTQNVRLDNTVSTGAETSNAKLNNEKLFYQ